MDLALAVFSSPPRTDPYQSTFILFAMNQNQACEFLILIFYFVNSSSLNT